MKKEDKRITNIIVYFSLLDFLVLIDYEENAICVEFFFAKLHHFISKNKNRRHSLIFWPIFLKFTFAVGWIMNFQQWIHFTQMHSLFFLFHFSLIATWVGWLVRSVTAVIWTIWIGRRQALGVTLHFSHSFVFVCCFD